MEKRHYFVVLTVCLFAISIFSCSKDNNIVKERTNLLFDLIASRETDSILTLYPDFDDSYMVIESDSIKITKVEENKEGGYDVVLTNFYSKDHMPSLMTTKQIVLSFTKNKDGEYYIKKSCGLLNTERMPYQAAATGYIQERSKDADVEVIKGMSILDSVVIFAKQERYERVKKQIKVEIVYNSVKDFYRISNYSDEYIQKLSFNGEFTYDHKNTSGIVFHNKCTVQDLPSNHNITVPFPLIDGDFFAILYRNANFSYRETGLFHLKSYDITNITFEFEIDYKGDEYANYLKKTSKGSS